MSTRTTRVFYVFFFSFSASSLSNTATSCNIFWTVRFPTLHATVDRSWTSEKSNGDPSFSASPWKYFLNTVDSFSSFAMQSHAFLLHQKTRLQHCARNRCELATTQFRCRCFYHAASEHTTLLQLISRLVTHIGKNFTQPPLFLWKIHHPLIKFKRLKFIQFLAYFLLLSK